MVARKLNNPKGQMTYITKVCMLTATKIGAELWQVKIPVSRKKAVIFIYERIKDNTCYIMRDEFACPNK